ncbi:COPII coat assembly protein SEC16 [Plectosphaerella plurivora]|uniref:Protein transport protein sec16 n=1 Tax=Plectosphaerella plurivora TaxID=936078 RepID=A0A9P8VAN7_9PEZI|nr:COPII coat assembly protein SEC16 [Plectosphaerella plurivora]
MASAANASWHPAMMPNNSTDASSDPQPTSVEPPLEDLSHAIEQSTPETETEMTSNAAAESSADAWLAEEPSEDWLAQEEHPTTNEEIKAAAPTEQAPEAAPEPVKTSDHAASAGPVLGHSSSISFARTVSHDISFADDEESDWNLMRNDTDPFKFMPPNDRTNSFPPVPPVAEPNYNQQDEPSQPEPLPQQDGPGFDLEGDEEQVEDGPQFAGRDALEDGEPDIGSRFVEGVPLISHDTNGDDSQAAPNGSAFFGDEAEAAAEDDFFGSINNSAPDASAPAPLERKSTMQVMDSLGTAPLSRNDTLEDMPEEAEEQGQPAQADESTAAPTEDLASKWQQAFAGDDDDDDFLLEDSAGETKEIDPAAFFGSDDEGFLEDDEDTAPAPAVVAPAAPQQAQPSQNKYAPQSTSPYAPQQHAAPNPYAPAVAALPTTPYTPSPTTPQFPAATPFAAQPLGQAAYGAPPPRPEPSKAQSFADKSKGGYSSPYDLPMDVVKPRKRASVQHLPRSTTPSTTPLAPPINLPPRSSSMNAPAPPPGPPGAAHGQGPPSAGLRPPSSASPSKESFFEDLPITVKPRSASRQSNRMPSPAFSAPPQGLPQGSPQGPPQASPTMPAYGQPEPAPSPSYLPQEPVQRDVPALAQSTPPGIANLVAPPRTNPYASLQPHPAPSPAIPGASRYSPAPPGQAVNGTTSRPASANRYSPAPTGSRTPSTSYSAPPAPAVLPHLPRTSSPLAHFEVSHDRAAAAAGPNGDVLPPLQRVSSYEPRLHRVPSLPPTREVEEEDDGRAAAATAPPVTSPVETKYAPPSPPLARHTPPPSAGLHGSPSYTSPSKRPGSSYAPQSHFQADYAPVAPPRSHTQSPGSVTGSRAGRRPSSSHGPTSPQAYHSQPAHVQPARPTHRPRGPSQSFNLVAPTDGREQDPLQRWKGTPVITWGIGGTLVTSFPKDIPRYGIGQTAPMMIRAPGEVHLKTVKDILPLEERLAKFPGPLKGKAKKKETVAWLTAGIESLERELPALGHTSAQSHDDKRMTERVLLWKVLRAFVEFDGVLEGKEPAEKAVRDILTPSLGGEQTASSLYGGGPVGGIDPSAITQMQSEGVDAGAVEVIREALLQGDREKAVWAAVDKRLWGHAMLISHTVSPDLYKKVADEFVRKEVNYTGHSNESIAALYKVLSGNHEDCIDELVPSHARAGMQLMNTTSAAGSVQDALKGLDKWRETLGLVLSNRSTDDIQAINALGNLLATYGRAEAAHICFIFSRKVTAFGGLDDTNASFVLVGADHRTQGEQFGKETEALLLSEVFEYGLSLASGQLSTGIPHLAGYKLQHALTLAEHGFRDKALQYCEAIAASMTAQTKRSPYHHAVLESAVDDLSRRLKQAPKGESSSWISKPSLNNVSDSMWNRFNKFVAGDEAEDSAAGKTAEGGVESGPFARIAGGTPTISPSPSTTNFDIYNTGNPQIPGYPSAPALPTAPATRASSRYAPMGGQPTASPVAQAPNPHEPTSYAPSRRVSNDYGQPPAEAPRASMDSQAGGYGGQSYTPQSYTPNNYGPAQPASPPSSQPEALSMAGPRTDRPPSANPYAPYSGHATPSAPPAAVDATPDQGYQAPDQGYQAPDQGYQAPDQGYQTPSYGYEPPSQVSSDVPEAQAAEPAEGSGGYEAPSYQPYGYEPPTYNPNSEPTQDDEDDAPKPKKKSFMDDDEDDIPALRAPPSQGKSKSEIDKENEEMFRKAAEEDAKRAAEQQAAKKGGWGFTGWWGGKKGEMPSAEPAPAQGNKPIRAKLGESSSFVYDPDLKRWVNKKGGADQAQAKTATPPPPRSNAGTPPPPGAQPGGPPGGPLRPPTGPPMARAPSQESLGIPPMPGMPGSAPAMARSASTQSLGAPPGPGAPPSRPPSRPATSMSNASSIDDLIGAAGPRKAGAKKPKRGGRYVDVMAK